MHLIFAVKPERRVEAVSAYRFSGNTWPPAAGFQLYLDMTRLHYSYKIKCDASIYSSLVASYAIALKPNHTIVGTTARSTFLHASL